MWVVCLLRMYLQQHQQQDWTEQFHFLQAPLLLMGPEEAAIYGEDAAASAESPDAPAAKRQRTDGGPDAAPPQDAEVTWAGPLSAC